MTSSADLPLVSVGLPVFNGARYLEGCLESILAQTYPHFELIISDNASTDDSARICERYANRDSRIRYFRVDHNRGAGWNHRHVQELARGAYFKWCGVDDLIAPRFLEACVDVLARSPDAVLAYPMGVVIDEAGETLEGQTTDRLDVDGPDPAIRFRTLLRPWALRHNPFYGVIRSASLATVRPIGTFLANDRSFLAELALRGPFVRVEEYLMYRRQHGYRPPDAEGYFFAADRARYLAREWRMLREHLVSILRAPGGIKVKLRLLGDMAAWTLEQRAELIGEARGFAGHVARRLGIWRSHASH